MIGTARWSWELKEQGFAVASGVLTPALLEALRQRYSPAALDQPSHLFSDEGAFVRLDYRDPLVVELLTWPATLGVLKEVGFLEPRLHSYYVSTKQPGAGPLLWHSDVFYPWARPEPPELFLIYSLSDTNQHNGCLRVVPGSHRWTDAIETAMGTTASPTSASRAGEADVPLRAGDLFIGDRRLLHATHANRSQEWRTVITVSYAGFDRLPEELQAYVIRNTSLPVAGWADDEAQRQRLDPRLRKILPVYRGTAVPYTS